jgi:hypothetical protein
MMSPVPSGEARSESRCRPPRSSGRTIRGSGATWRPRRNPRARTCTRRPRSRPSGPSAITSTRRPGAGVSSSTVTKSWPEGAGTPRGPEPGPGRGRKAVGSSSGMGNCEQVVNINQASHAAQSLRFGPDPAECAGAVAPSLATIAARPYVSSVTGTAPLVCGNIPVALLNSEGAGSVRALVRLPGAHLCMQVLGN